MSVLLAVCCGISLYNTTSTTITLLTNYKKSKTRTYILSWLSVLTLTISTISSITYLQTKTIVDVDISILVRLLIIIQISNYSTCLSLIPILSIPILNTFNLSTRIGKSIILLIIPTILMNTLFLITFVTCSLSTIKTGFGVEKCFYIKTLQISFVIKVMLDLVLLLELGLVLLYIHGVEVFDGSVKGMVKVLFCHDGCEYLFANLGIITTSILGFRICMEVGYDSLMGIFVLMVVWKSVMVHLSVKRLYSDTIPVQTTKVTSTPPVIGSHSIRERGDRDRDRERERDNDDNKSELKVKGSLPGNTIEAMANIKLGRTVGGNGNNMDDRRSVISRHR